MKRLIAVLLVATLLLALPMQAMAKKMEDHVPVWTEDAVRLYVQNYAEGINMDLLYSYYDLQIRRYMPMDTFRSMLTELEWLTGEFICLGEYSSFEENEHHTKTHVIHLHMEKQDLDVYFTHKNYEDDWEVMAVEFVPAENQEIDVGFAVDSQMTVQLAYEEIPVTVGDGTEHPLNGLLTLPKDLTDGQKVPACVLVHDAGPLDMNASVGATRFFEYLARELADMGIASIRYDKRTYTYGESADMTVYDEVVEDALLAVKLLEGNDSISNIFVIGHGFGTIVAPRIARDANGSVAGMILIGGRPISYARQLLEKADLSAYSDKDAANIVEMATNMNKKSEEIARSFELFGRNGYYFWEMEQHNPIGLIMRLGLPTYIVQGRNDAHVSEEDGWRAYAEELKNYGQFVSYNSYRGLNHMLANDLSVDANGDPQYALDAGIDVPAVRDLADWLLAQQPTTMEEE